MTRAVDPDSGASDQQHFDAQWSTYWLEVQRLGPLTHTRYRLLLEEVPEAPTAVTSILDVGCGPGIFLHELGERFPAASLQGVEYSTTALEAASPRLRARILQGDILEVAGRLAPASFDLIVCSEVLEHVRDPQAVVVTLTALAAPGATLLLTVPAGMQHWCAQDEAAGHLRRFETDEFRALLNHAGLEVPRLYTWGGPVSAVYNTLIDSVGPAKAARTSGSRLGRMAARIAASALRFDDWWKTDRGFQLIARARKPGLSRAGP